MRLYCFHEDEIAEAEAQGLPYILVPRELSREEWEKKYCPKEPEASLKWREPLEVVDSSGLTDDDWAKINRLRHLHESGGS
jgi:hypothetical protein